MGRDDELSAARGILNGIVAGLICWAIILLTIWLIATIVQAEEHIPYEPAEQDWLTPYPPGKSNE